MLGVLFGVSGAYSIPSRKLWVSSNIRLNSSFALSTRVRKTRSGKREAGTWNLKRETR